MTGGLVFNPGRMGDWAGALRDMGGQAGAVSSMLFLADSTGLPPDIAGEVEAEIESLRRLLDACEATLDGSGRYLSGVATRVRQSDDDPGDPLGLTLVKGVATVGPAEAAAWGRGQSLDGKRVHGLAGLAASLTGVGALEKAVRWSAWNHAVRTSGIQASAGRRRKLAGAVRQRMAEGAATPDLDARADNRRRNLARALGRLAPVAGAASSLDAYVGASRKFQADEPQTGISQVATDVRDLTALVAASYNLEAEVPFLAPVAKPIGLVTDGAVLAMDTGYSMAEKGHDGAKWLGDQAIGGVKDLGRGLAGRLGL